MTQHGLPHQRDHPVAAAKGERSDHQKIEEQLEVDHAFSSFRSFLNR